MVRGTMQTVILAGGKGTRYDITQPKVMAKIGDKPIIHHVMEIYHHQGHSNFILALGYQKEYIIHYFNNNEHDYNIQFIDTGENTNTGERIKLVQPYLRDEKRFFCTYGDGLSSVDLMALEVRHISGNNIATMTAVRPQHQFGILVIDNNKVISFEEKPRMQEYINGGFFMFDRNIFRYIKEGDVLETDTLPRLLPDKLGAYKHEGFWDTLNTQKDEMRLNEMYARRKHIIDWLVV